MSSSLAEVAKYAGLPGVAIAILPSLVSAIRKGTEGLKEEWKFHLLRQMLLLSMGIILIAIGAWGYVNSGSGSCNASGTNITTGSDSPIVPCNSGNITVVK